MWRAKRLPQREMARRCQAHSALQRLQQARHVVGVVREVGVHLEDDVGLQLAQRVPHAADVGGAEAAPLALEQVHVRVAALRLAHDAGGAVGRAVVDDEDRAVVPGAGERRLQRVDQATDVLGLVVRRQDDDDLQAADPCSARVTWCRRCGRRRHPARARCSRGR
jgi:hypothetical protein